MWLIAGLGNPGEEYAYTRHNIGFMVVDALSRKYHLELKQKTSNFIYTRGFIEEKEVILLKPLTFMNRSGIALREAIYKFEDIEELLVIHDDLDLEPGAIRIRKAGSSGGHNGIQSIIDYLNSSDFIRIKIGIGRSQRISPEKYVLRSFNRHEMPSIEEAIIRAVDAVSIILTRGIQRAQNEMHKRI